MVEADSWAGKVADAAPRLSAPLRASKAQRRRRKQQARKQQQQQQDQDQDQDQEAQKEEQKQTLDEVKAADGAAGATSGGSTASPYAADVEEHIESLSIKELKGELNGRGISVEDCLDSFDLKRKLRQALACTTPPPPPAAAALAPHQSSGQEEWAEPGGHEAPAASTWSCPVCTLDNDASATVCTACGCSATPYPRAAAVAAAAAAAAAAACQRGSE